MLHRASELSSAQKAALESLLGREISDRETISVRAFEPTALSDAQRDEILKGLDDSFARIDAKSSPASDVEAEDIITEAMRSTRPNYRQIR